MSDILALFIADLNRSLDGLQQSMGRGPSAQGQAALHARDLSDALHGVNLPRHAELASAVSRHLASGRGGMHEAAQELLRLTRSSIDSLNSNQAPNHQAQDEALAALARSLAVYDVNEMNFDSAAFRATLDASRTALEVSDQNDAPVAVPTEALVESHEALAQPLDSNLRVEQAAPLRSSADLRLALAQLQAIDHEIAELSHYEPVRQARFRLSDHASWLVSCDQIPLAQALGPRFADASQSLRVDSAVAQVLSELMAELDPSISIDVSLQQMTVFMLLRGIGAQSEQNRALRKAAEKLRGRLEFLPEGARLVFPSSLMRLRVVPFRRNGQLYAVSWAQLMGGETLKSAPGNAADLLGDASSARLQLQLSVADQPQRLYADELCPFQLANVFELPSITCSPPWVAGVLVGSETDAMLWVAPSDF